MILLTQTTDTLEVITSAAVTVDVHVSWMDVSGTTVTPGRTNTAITTATTTVILAAPASSTQRNAKTINIRNKHASTAVTITVLFDQNTTNFELHKVTLAAGEALEYIEGIGFFVLGGLPQAPTLYKSLAADDAGGSASASAQPWFPTAGGVTVQASTTYQFNGNLVLTTGATTHTTGTLFAGTATLTSIDYNAVIFTGPALTIATTLSRIKIQVATVIVLNATSTAVEHTILVDGVVKINAAGTFIPQFQFSANPTGTITVKRGTYFRMSAMAADTQGTWA